MSIHEENILSENAYRPATPGGAAEGRAILERRRDNLLADLTLAERYEHNAHLVPGLKARLAEVDAALRAAPPETAPPRCTVCGQALDWKHGPCGGTPTYESTPKEVRPPERETNTPNGQHGALPQPRVAGPVPPAVSGGAVSSEGRDSVTNAQSEEMVALVGELRERIKFLDRVIWEHHSIAAIREAYEQLSGECDVCVKHGGIELFKENLRLQRAATALASRQGEADQRVRDFAAWLASVEMGNLQRAQALADRFLQESRS